MKRVRFLWMRSSIGSSRNERRKRRCIGHEVMAIARVWRMFEKLLDTYEGDSYFTDLPVDETDLDFAGNIKMKSKKGKKGGEDDSDSDLDDDLDDVSLGSLDEEDFGDELGEEGGAFMDSIGEDDEEVPELDDDNADSDEMEVPHIRPGSKMRKASEDLDFSGSLGSKPGKKRKGGHSHVCIC
ncbi:CCAAT/enhancer-binding protein zeta-like isoform 2-T3 [Salvelinus alpinus]